MAILKPTAIRIAAMLGLAAKPTTLLSTVPSARPSTMPMKPPIRQRMTLSVMNCMRMADAGAPSALRVPISRVRSVTETIMIFITPMPPTSSDSAAMAEMPSETVLIMLVIESSRLARLEALTVQESLRV